MKTLFCFGYSYCARHLHALLGTDWRVIATTRDSQKIAELEAQGVETRLLPSSELQFPPRTHLLISAAPDPEGDPMLRAHRDDILRAASNIDWIGYLSTTSVYGNRDGGWVDEDTPPEPTSARGERRLRAELDWLDLTKAGLPVHVFRLAGIYGPGRNALEKLREGNARSIIKPGQVFGRIHVADIARILRASIDRPMPGAVFNVTDDLPASPQDVQRYAAELLGCAPPPEIAFEDADLSAMAREFYRESKRVRNDKLKKALGIGLAFPTYREGLRAIHGQSTG